MKIVSPIGKTQYKAFTLLSMIYVTIILSADVLIYKLAQVGNFTFTVGSLVTPFWFLLTDIIAEVYGYQLTRRLIWSGILCGCIFTCVCVSLIHLPSPSSWHLQGAYDQVLGNLPRILLGCVAGVFAGSFANTYLITKWKILIQGKYFWLRSLGSSGTGQLVFTSVTILFDMLGVIPFYKIIQLITLSFTIKIVVTALFSLPSAILVLALKKLEGVDVYDHNTDFNPFKLSVVNL